MKRPTYWLKKGCLIGVNVEWWMDVGSDCERVFLVYVLFSVAQVFFTYQNVLFNPQTALLFFVLHLIIELITTKNFH